MQRPITHLPLLPSPAERRIAVRITPQAERAMRQRHPWLYAEAITKQSHEGQPGDLAVIFDSQRKFLAIGLYDPTSQIRVRVLQHRKPAQIDQDWFKTKIEEAAQIRASLPTNTNGYRLVHGENDGLPGLVIDRYDESFVLKLYTPGWIPYLPILITLLKEYLTPERVVLRLSRGMLRYPEFLHRLEDGAVIWGNPLRGPVLFLENRITFEVDLQHGQKTGFFLDQRDNRAKVERISHGKSVLNVFAYTGGFSVYAARGGAHEVISVDISQPALDAAKRNFAHNNDHPKMAACYHVTRAGDAFKLLSDYALEKRNFDIIIIDPPSFAKKIVETRKALAAYQQLTRLGLAVLTPGGMLVQASCSSRVSAAEFFSSIHQAARQAGRPLNEIERTGHAIDHPIGFPEGEYLKCLFAYA
jgi:23S rRNA (cytosine1962-C5)-methyltransferase